MAGRLLFRWTTTYIRAIAKPSRIKASSPYSIAIANGLLIAPFLAPFFNKKAPLPKGPLSDKEGNEIKYTMNLPDQFFFII